MTSVFTVIINSRDRISGTKDNFLVRINPVLNNIRSLSLQSCQLPFNFNNVTTQYGNTILFHLFTLVHDQFIQITIPNGYYSIQQLIVVLNQAMIDFYAALPNLPAGTNICPISFSFSPIPDRINLNFNASFYNGAPATLTFLATQTGTQLAHLYRMLGLPDDEDYTFTFPAGPTSFQFQLPLPASNHLPISYVFINISDLPTKVISSSQHTGQFYIDISPTLVHGEQVEAPVSYKINRDYWNDVYLPANFFNFKEVTVSLTDSRGKSLFDQNVTEWSLTMLVETY